MHQASVKTMGSYTHMANPKHLGTLQNGHDIIVDVSGMTKKGFRESLEKILACRDLNDESKYRIEKALRETGEKLTVRQCCKCKEWLDEESKTVVETRHRLHYLISHGFCEPCDKEQNAEIDAWIEAQEESIPDTERAPDSEEPPDTMRSVV